MELNDRSSQARYTVAAWYTGRHFPDDITRQAFEAAKLQITNELQEKDQEIILASGLVSMQDFLTTLLDARSKYESRRSGKAFAWLEKLSSRVMYYATVLDVLVQQNPEYVSLVWGSFKFLFSSVINQEEMVKNLAKSCALIAETLPRADLSLVLYPTPAMREALARLYAAIVKFIVRSIRWYRKGRMQHVLTSIANPWSLEYESELREVEQHARSVDKLAQSGSQAELRDAHLRISQLQTDLQATRGEIKILASFVEEKFREITEFALASQSLQQRISKDISSSKNIITQVQISQILSLSFMESLPTSGQCLAHCRSFYLRRRAAHTRQPPFPPKLIDTALQKTIMQQNLSFLVTQSHSPAKRQDLLIDIITLLRRHGLPVLWVLRYPDLRSSSIAPLDIIRILLYQALEINSAALNTPFPITIAQLREASSHHDWLALLKRALRGLPVVHIVFDADVVEHVSHGDKGAATQFLAEFARFISPGEAKFIVSSSVFDTERAERHSVAAEAVAVLKTEVARSRESAHVLKRRRLRGNVKRRGG